MSRKIRARILSLILLLGVVTGVLSTPHSQAAHAMMCCETCAALWQECVAATNYGPCYGDSLCCSERYDCFDCTWC